MRLGLRSGRNGGGEGEGAPRLLDMERFGQAAFEAGGALARCIGFGVSGDEAFGARDLVGGGCEDRIGGGDLIRMDKVLPSNPSSRP